MAETSATPRMLERYRDQVVPALREQFQYHNVMQVPCVQKVTLNVGLGEALQNGKLLESAVTELATITGQKPVVTRARKSIANFRLREGQAIGAAARGAGASAGVGARRRRARGRRRTCRATCCRCGW